MDAQGKHLLVGEFEKGRSSNICKMCTYNVVVETPQPEINCKSFYVEIPHTGNFVVIGQII